jgi:predicted metalloprotease with PDZ domain
MPAWIPGSYMIRDFARNVVEIHAEDDNGPLSIEKRDKDSWYCTPAKGALRLCYVVYAWDLSVRAAHLDRTHGYFNGTSVFLAVDGQEQQPCSVEIRAPRDQGMAHWSVATTLPRKNAPLFGFGTYAAADYDELVDHPVEMGVFDDVEFEVAGVPHHIIITGRHRTDRQRLCADVQRICRTHVDMFGELPAMERYMFLLMVVGDGYGGLEHRSSSSLMCSRAALPLANKRAMSDNYASLLGLFSHEYFHLWNVKRIKPQVFTPYDLSHEVHTCQLWAFEGITSYYDDLGLVRSGVIDQPRYLQMFAQLATRVWRAGGRHRQSVAESSFDAWTKFYKQDENAPNAIVSYYSKGALIAMALDLTLREATDDQHSLDDLMRLLWEQYGRPGKGVPEGAIEQHAAEIAGCDLSQFFQRYLYGKEDVPLQGLLAKHGVEFTLRPAINADDKGGALPEPAPESLPVHLGARVIADPAGARLTHVFEQGPAHQGGLAAQDLIIALDGIKVGKENLETLIAAYPPDSKVTIHAFRRDELMTFEVSLPAAPADTCVLVVQDEVSEAVKQRRERWLDPSSEDKEDRKRHVR